MTSTRTIRIPIIGGPCDGDTYPCEVGEHIPAALELPQRSSLGDDVPERFAVYRLVELEDGRQAYQHVETT